MHGWIIVLTTAMVICAIPLAVEVGRWVHSAESHAIASEIATRHAVARPALIPADRPANDAGAPPSEQHNRVWVDDAGNPAAPPRTEIDARTSGVAAGLMLWLSLATTTGVLLRALGRFTDRRRYRAWDRSLVLLVNDGGGSNAHNS